MVKFAYAIHYVQDVEKTVSFYEKAFGLTRKLVTPDGSYGELSTGQTTLSFATVALAGSNLPDGFQVSHLSNKPFGIELGFTTAQVEETLAAAVAAGAVVVAPSRTKPWGQVVAYVRDPDGLLIEICTPMDEGNS